MNAEERRNLDKLRDIPEDYRETEEYDVDDFLHGRIPVPLHQGDGRELLQDNIQAAAKKLGARLITRSSSFHFPWNLNTKLLIFCRAKPKRPRRKDNRDRWDRTLRRNIAWDLQMPKILEAYLVWSYNQGEDPWSTLGDSYEGYEVESIIPNLKVVDIYSTYHINAEILKEDTCFAAGLIRQGLVPCAPLKIKVAFTIRVIEVFRNLHLRCPSFSKHAFVKGICDISKIPFTKTLSQQFSIVYDVYLDIRERCRKRVAQKLGLDAPHTRLKTCCPACTYKLEGEEKLIFEMLFTMDGNDSLKRMLRRTKLEEWEEDEKGDLHRDGPSKERPDDRVPPGDYYLDRADVDKWTKEVLTRLLAEGAQGAVDEEGTPCEERWKNMVNELTARMWGIFDETGIFLALCRHGFVLVVADMVKSGEMAKYPVAVVELLLNVFGEGLVGGYDIGCKLRGTLRRSPLGDLAAAMGYNSFVGAFHGHAHNRLCQLKCLVSYITGMGIDDLEGCERYFAKSNALAASTRYASVFHRQQEIVTYMMHTDLFDTAENLSAFLCTKYRLAKERVALLPALKKWMRANQVQTFETFNTWLKEEFEWLSIRSKEPKEETLEMEYYQKLVNYYASQEVLQKQWDITTAERHRTEPLLNDLYREAQRVGQIESKRRAALEYRDKNLETVLNLEAQLGITERWKPGFPDWEKAAVLVSNRRYQRCIDDLEGKIVARLFELTDMNQSHTGYAMRKHMAQALSTRSQAIKTSLEKYNAAAAALEIPRPPLTWEEVVDYVFLSDFDLLRDTNRVDPADRPWGEPGARLATNNFNKICRGREEIKRLNIEIRRHITKMRDEDISLQKKIEETSITHPAISHQISIHHEECTRFNHIHMERYRSLALEAGFTGTLRPGVRRRSDVEDTVVEAQAVDLMDVEVERDDAELTAEEAERRGVDLPPDVEEDWMTVDEGNADSDDSDSSEDEEEDQVVSGISEQLLNVTFDE
ncbi:hypothetical protein GGX14DRAFT_382252 [Mycena pura]|uniref:CxC1-like cysteine cluster associated with KDZ transposases domain-containing protein n=1 Tax=Mycena pura TaxID=153505 RepID=A0AAD6UQZ2_9AGAR|nr:hypothetical protein GGX14DRAFT_382252 [Mycena pura]